MRSALVLARRALLLLVIPFAFGTAFAMRRVRASSACPTSTTPPPDLPAGHQCLVTRGAEAILPRAGSGGITLSVVNEATAPGSPPQVLQIATTPYVAPSGTRPPPDAPDAPPPTGARAPTPGGSSGGGAGTRPPPNDGRSIEALTPLAARQSEVFVSVWIRWSASWLADPSGLALGLLVETAAGSVSLRLGTTSPDGVMPGLAVAYAPTAVSLSANRVTPAALVANQWYRWEIQVVPSAAGATLRWWVNGALTGEHTGVLLWTGNPVAITALGWEGRPGMQPSPPAWYAEVDEVFLAGKGIEDGVEVLDNTVPAGYGGATDHETVVLMDMRQNVALPCDTNVEFHGAGPFYFPNLLASATCDRMRDPTRPFQDAVAVLSAGNRFELVEGTLWDDAVGNMVTVHLVPPLMLNLKVWLLDPSYSYTQAGVVHTVDARTLATNQVIQALQLFDDNLTGLTFNVSYWPASGTTSEQAVARAAVGDLCGTVDSWTPPAPYWQADAINVYFVAPIATSTTVPSNMEGNTCFIVGDKAHAGSIVFMYLKNETHAATLTHELGHVMALWHTAESALTCGGFSFDKQNLMYGYMADDQKSFTLGQAFRINVDGRSAASVLPAVVPRTSPLTTRSCGRFCYSVDNFCLALMHR